MTATRVLLAICVSIVVASTIFAQAGQKIAKIEAEGLQSLTAETVIATSGLKIGDSYSDEALDAAAERLLN